MNNVTKLLSSEFLKKQLYIDAINGGEKNDVDFSLQSFANIENLANNYKKANENYKTTEVKDEFKKLGIEFKTKEDYFKEVHNTSKQSLSDYMKIANCTTEKMIEYKAKNEGKKLSIKSFLQFIKDENSLVMNTTKTQVTQSSTTEKPQKITTTSKHIEAKIFGGTTKADAIELINQLMEKYAIVYTELKPKKVSKKKAVAVA